MEPGTSLTRPRRSNFIISRGWPSMICKQSQCPDIPFSAFHGVYNGNSAFKLLENLFLMVIPQWLSKNQFMSQLICILMLFFPFSNNKELFLRIVDHIISFRRKYVCLLLPTRGCYCTFVVGSQMRLSQKELKIEEEKGNETWMYPATVNVTCWPLL